MRALPLVRVTPFFSQQHNPRVSKSNHDLEEAVEGVKTPSSKETKNRSTASRRSLEVWLLFWLVTATLLGGSGILGAWLLLRMPSSNCENLSPLTSPGETLHCARQAVESGETNQLLLALDLVAKVPKDHALYSEAERLMGEWSQKALELAQEAIHKGDLQGGITIADRVPVLSSLYPDAQAAIASWQEEWQQGENIVQQFQTALATQDGESATKLYLSLSEFESDYWRTVRSDELMYELSGKKAVWQRMNEIEPLLTSEVSEVVKTAMLLAVEFNSIEVAEALAKAEKEQQEQILLEFVASLWQKKHFQEAIKIAQMISPNQDSYNTAQDWILLSRLSEAAENENTLADAIAAIRHIDSSSSVYPLAQKQALQWEAQAQKQAQKPSEDAVTHSQSHLSLSLILEQTALFQEQAAENLLEKAQDLARQGDLAIAIETAQKISSHRDLYSEAQRSIQSWKRQLQTLKDRETLQTASTLAVQGKISEAIQIAEQIQPNHPLYQQAKIAIATWRSQLNTSE